MHRTGKNQAFTLIELLVVIAIIAILAAILFPVFARAREQARQATGLSNLKQQALGMLMYVQDYDETFCPTLGWGDATIGLIQWQTAITPYIKNGKVKTETSNQNDPYFTGEDDGSVFVSPAWRKPAPMVDASGTRLTDICPSCYTNAKVARYSYAMNQRIAAIFWLVDPNTGAPAGWCNFGALACTEGSRNATLAEIAMPANMVMLSESFDAPMNGMATWGADMAWLQAQDRFNGNTVVALVDGHVKTQKGAASCYTLVQATPMAECQGWWWNNLPDPAGSPIASCAKNRPTAGIFFGPRQGR